MVMELITAYTRDSDGWYELDMLHRRLEKRASSLEFALVRPTGGNRAPRHSRTTNGIPKSPVP